MSGKKEEKSCINCKWYSSEEAYMPKEDELHTIISGCVEINVTLLLGEPLEDFYCSRYKPKED